MGKSYSPVVADIFMGHWEAQLDDLATQEGAELLFAMRYADDYCIGFRGSRASLDSWVARLNAINPNIKVALEVERDRRLSFLDILLHRADDGIRTSVFRKACYTGQVVPYDSFCERRYQEAGIRSDATRALRYCEPGACLLRELNFVRNVYRKAGYPVWFINRAIAKSREAERAGPEEKEPPEGRFLSVPFTGPLFFQLRQAAANIGIRLVSKTTNTLGSRLTPKLKAPTPHGQESNVVYRIDCSCGSVYIGETGQELQSRVAQHEAAHRRRDPKSAFGMPDHHDCRPEFPNTSVLAREPNNRLRLLKESAFIRTVRETVLRAPNDDNINRNSGTLLEDRWLPALSALTGF